MRPFSWIRERLSLRARLLGAFALVMALSLVPAVMIEDAEEAALAALDRVVRTDKRISDLSLRGIATFLNARRQEKDFLLYYREFGFKEARARYVTRVQTSIAELQQQMKELREVAGDADTRAQTEQIERAASEYLANFLDAVELYESLAVQHRGPVARNRRTLEELSPKLSARTEPRLAAGYLGLYRAGLNLIEDPGAAEFERAIGELDAYARSASAALPANARAAFEAQVKSYRDTATAILGAATQIAEHRSAYLKAAQTVEPLLDTLHLTRVKAAQHSLDAVHANAEAKDRNAIVSGVLALLTALALAVFTVLTLLTNWYLGASLLLALYFALIMRGLMIAANAPTFFTRLLAGSITLTFFTYAVVNMGMVSGLLPVVGVPLPLISYGGTSLVTLFVGIGMLMSIQHHRALVQS